MKVKTMKSEKNISVLGPLWRLLGVYLIGMTVLACAVHFIR